jgi:D-glycero-D-manno-heptose 1,7-bisphosphate phosphatase
MRPAPDRARPLLFLDRDGVIVKEVHYLHRISDIGFYEGVANTIRAARAVGWGAAIITNQAGIGRGLYGWPEFATVNAYILDWLEAQGAPVDAVLATPHHPEGQTPFQHPDHPMRKPNPGMIVAALTALHGVADKSVVVGDNASDLEAGRRAGLLQGFHVMTGHGERYRKESEALATERFRVTVVADAGDPAIAQCFKTDGALS